MVEAEPVAHAGAAVVAADREALEAQSPHQLDLVPGHRPLGVRLVVGVVVGLRALAVAAEVGGDDGEALGQSAGATACHITWVCG